VDPARLEEILAVTKLLRADILLAHSTPVTPRHRYFVPLHSLKQPQINRQTFKVHLVRTLGVKLLPSGLSNLQLLQLHRNTTRAAEVVRDKLPTKLIGRERVGGIRNGNLRRGRVDEYGAVAHADAAVAFLEAVAVRRFGQSAPSEVRDGDGAAVAGASVQFCVGDWFSWARERACELWGDVLWRAGFAIENEFSAMF
jgi:hypothetical protein